MNSNPSRVSPCKTTPLSTPLRKWLFAILAVMSVIISIPQAAAQTSVTLNSTRDSDMYAGGKNNKDANKNYGACNIMWVGGEKNEIVRGIVGFDLSSLPANITIQSATLRMVRVSGSESEDTSRNISIHAVSQAWTEGTGNCDGNSTSNVSWFNRTGTTAWTTAGGTFGGALATTSVGNLGAYTWSSASLLTQVRNWYNTPTSNHGLVLRYASESSSRYKHFATKENGTAADRPQLQLTYTFNCTTTISGPTSVCVGSNITLTANPSDGGIWSTLNPGRSSVSSTGVVTGLAAGPATIRFTQGGCTYDYPITVDALPSLGGATEVCVGSTATVTPTSGGTWSSNNTSRATVTNSGVVTGVSAGSVVLTFTNSTTGCSQTRNFTVNPRPTVGGATSVCVGSTANVTPSTGGTWTSGNPSVAIVSPSGLVEGIVAGTATLTFTSSTTGCTQTRSITVNNLPSLGGATSVAVTATANVTPSTGGTWSSNDETIATVTNSGVVTGVSSGTAILTFTSSTTGCSSTRSINVFEVGQIGGATSVCVGFTANVTPTDGTWTSSDPTIAIVDNNGLVTGVSPGTVTLEYTADGVTQTTSFTVNAPATLGGATTVCAGSVSNVTPSSGGFWSSSNTSVAAVNNAGQVVGISPGTATLTFTTLDGCVSSKSFEVLDTPVLSSTAVVKVAGTASITPSSGGTWTSSDETIATITDTGVITGVSLGSVVLTFTSDDSACSQTKFLTVISDDFYTNIAIVTPGNEPDPDPENNTDPEDVDPQSWTALVVSVFSDVTGNGLGDNPLGGIEIIVRDSEDNVVFIGTTGPDGTLSINDLVPGFYTVTQTVPDGTFTLYDNPIAVSITLGETSNADFVNSTNGSISGTVFNGFEDEVLPDVLIALLNEDGSPVLDDDGQPITTVTDENGFYQFLNLPPGSYMVQQTVPSGFSAAQDVDGDDLTLNGDVTPITILPGANVTEMDFVNVEPAKIIGTVFIDTTINGGGDTPQEGVVILLLDANGDPVRDEFNQPITTITNAEGEYEFTNLPPGDYQVAQVVPAGFTAIDDTDGGDFTIVGDVELISVAAGDVAFAGFTNQPQTDIAVTKSIDNPTPVAGTQVEFTITVTNNGPNDAEEVVVEEFGSGLNFDSASATQGTFTPEPGAPIDALLGLWEVGALAVGESATLTIVATVSASTDVSFYSNRVVASSELGDPDPTNNEDEVPFDPILGSISGIILVDTTGDSNGNVPQEGVTVILLDENGTPLLDSNGNLITTTTDEFGVYTFDNLPPGNYQIAQVPPTGFIAVNDADGGDFTINGDVTPITVVAGVPVTDQNFVNSELGSIAGNVSRDLTGNLQGDTSLEFVVVVLLDLSGNVVLDAQGDPITTTTDAFGNYVFDGVPSGQYQVAIVTPVGLFAVNDVDGGDLTINGDQTPISVLPGQDVADQDFVLNNLLPPVALNDESLSNPPGPVTLNVTDNDSDPNDDLDVSTVQFVGTNNPGDPLVVTGEGTWTVDEFGNVTFTPESGFNADPTPVNYTVSDTTGLVSNEATITIDYVPVASDDESLGNPIGQPVTIPVTSNDTNGDTVDPTTVVIVGAPGDGTELEVPGEGTWTVDPVTGDITFTPEEGFTGDPTPITYTVEDEQGNVSNPAEVVVGYTVAPIAVNDSSTGNTPGTPVTLDSPENDIADPNRTLDLTSVTIDGALGDGSELIVPGEGIWTVDPVTGAITFTPESGFTLDPTPIQYTIADDQGNVSNLATVTVDYVPVATDDESLGNPIGQPVTIPVTANDTTGDTVDPTTVVIVGAPGDGTELEVPGEGTWTVDPVTGDITFTPEDGFTGDPTPITYTVEDEQGNVSNPAEVVITYAPEADLAVTKVSDNATPFVGTEITFTIQVTNLGPSNATGVFATDLLPSGYQFVSADPSVGAYDAVSGIWTIGALALNQVETLDITATVLTTGTYLNTVTVVGDQPDPDPENDTDTDEPEPIFPSISGTILLDTTGDGDGDSPHAGVVLILLNEFGMPVMDGTSVVTAVTDSNGDYIFEGLAPGTYRVQQVVPAGFVAISDVDGGVLTINGDVTPIVISGGQDSTGQDFVNTQPGVITGTVTIDTTGDNVGNTPQEGVTVRLFNADNVEVAVTTTGSNGTYTFSNVMPGEYTIVQDVPQDFTAVNDADGGDFTVIGDQTPVTVQPGELVDEQFFVNSQFATIAGNVFEDLNGLSDGIVNGTGTNAGGIFINLVDATTNQVVASIPVNADGTYSFGPSDGLEINSSYLLILTTAEVAQSTLLTTSSLPSPWVSTGENLGAGPGNDGTVDGVLAVNTTVGAIAEANFGIQRVPDVSPTITASPSIMIGPTDFDVRVRIAELNNVDTMGTIIVRVLKDPRWTLREPYDNTMTLLGTFPVNNNVWSYSQNATHHIFTTTDPSVVIQGGDVSFFGIKARWVSANQQGKYTMSVAIDAFSGGEVKIDNNNDAESLVFDAER